MEHAHSRKAAAKDLERSIRAARINDDHLVKN
jgi:hypothetical protein